MMHIDNKHRVLDVFTFRNEEEFMFAKNIPDNIPCYILIGQFGTYEMHGYNMLGDPRQPCKLADEIESFFSYEEIPQELPDWTVVYVVKENQIYQKYDGVFTKGFIFVSQAEDKSFNICIFDDFFEIEKVEIFDTCEQLCNELFVHCNFETMEGRLKPYERPRCLYCKESRNLYAIVDDKNLNLIHSDVDYGNIQSNKSELIVSKSKRLFSHGSKIESFIFTYDELSYKFRFA